MQKIQHFKMFKMILKSTLSANLRSKIRAAQKNIVYFWRRQFIRVPIAFNMPLKIILGAALTRQPGWYSTNEQWLDITQISNWQNVFCGKKRIASVLAEHVFEHLTPEETHLALSFISHHMVPGGRIRIAVPDGFNPDVNYVKHVGIGGIGPDAADHKQLLNNETLQSFLQGVGFQTEVMEGYLRTGELVQKPLDIAHGFVFRSRSNKLVGSDKLGWSFKDANTSLVVDGIKSI